MSQRASKCSYSDRQVRIEIRSVGPQPEKEALHSA